MQISKEIVSHTGHLARLHLSDDELELYSSQLNKILEYIEKLKKIDITNIAPTFNVLNLKNVLRVDTVRPSLTSEEALKNAPDKQDNFFVVPKVY
ncbi:MAG: Asp-tRNA(Asn)/Glu-tRNA(Gln) amidotransferase subunit GatC [Candidatus Saelkia tenebricola]|nr:Asp-tRNA(Asn)/Glu-tRNA(Gln) amidotransferase subunit GatC [Candidatus Saelkia tenebricola]